MPCGLVPVIGGFATMMVCPYRQSVLMDWQRGAVDLPFLGRGFTVNQHFLVTAPTSVGRRLGGLLMIPNFSCTWLVASAPTCFLHHTTQCFLWPVHLEVCMGLLVELWT